MLGEEIGIQEATARIDVEVRKTSSGDDLLMVVKSEMSKEDEDFENTKRNTPKSIAESKSNIADLNSPRKPNTLSSALDCSGLLSRATPYSAGESAVSEEPFVVIKSGDENDYEDVRVTSENVCESVVTSHSDLRHRSRRIWVVTTAGLPWRTGTAVNPLWRAVYLALDGHSVVLMIPWLADINSRKKLYGPENYFPNGPGEQSDWIFKEFIGIDRIPSLSSSKLINNLQILFWNGIYQESFGSIFPTEDICSLVPSDQADVAILEEPEHLNWFRIIPPSKSSQQNKKSCNAKDIDRPVESASGNCRYEVQLPSNFSGIEATKYEDNGPVTSRASVMDTCVSNDQSDEESSEENINILGWASKFQYVIGILHTNYGDYIRQYGMMGTAFLGAPALHALSTLVVRAYCHKVVRLSDTLPSFWTSNHSPHYNYPPNTTLEGLAECMEVTCNVHGVRNDFLDPADAKFSAKSNEIKPASVYFIGKLIWAKGFEQVLELQELFKSQTTDYFEIDVYGSGNDEKAIQRAFLGRHGVSRDSSTLSPTRSDLSASSRPTSPEPDFVVIDHPTPTGECNTLTDGIEATLSGLTTSNVETGEEAVSNRESSGNIECSNTNGVDPFNILGDLSQRTIGTGVETADAAMRMVESIMQVGLGAFGFGGIQRNFNNDSAGSKEVSASGNSIDGSTVLVAPPSSNTALETGKNSIEKQIQQRDQQSQQQAVGIPFHLAPARARFKWRRYPIPARFLGVQDHIIVRDIPEHKVFLNMSTSEVLCTTSAEALAMGKFVILPKHPSNTYFLQFPNCLAYETLEDCVVKLRFALSNNPKPLTDEYRRTLSWEGATERLYDVVAISNKEQTFREMRNVKQIGLKAAKFHVEASMKSHFVGSLFGGNKLLQPNASSQQ